MDSGFDNLIQTMRLFRRRQQGPSSGAAASQPEEVVPPDARSPGRSPGRSPAREEQDWRTFDLIADQYARTQSPAHAAPAGDLVELLQIKSGARVLDVGTGTGVAARAARERAGPEGQVVGIDVSVPMIARAERVPDGPQYVAAAAIDLPFGDASFDDVTATFVITLFQRYDTALFDILRVLKRAGRMGVATWGAHDSRDEFRDTWRAVAEEFAEPSILRDAIARAIPWEERFSDRMALKQTLHDAGLRDIWVEKRDYRFEMSREDWLTGRETAALGRFLRQMLGTELWGVFSTRVRDVFAERFPSTINDFREVNLAVGHKP
jgi:ubiquinone/menaquinone biosynthesis C-methylase UbiE